MSGITPLLDTLLHQVLGKRADVPPPRVLNEPVKPTAPAEAAKAVHSDSRLETRSPAPSAEGLARPGRQGSAQPAVTSGASPTPSALTHFSASARTIADLLLRFPAPPSAVTPAAPLVSSGQAVASPALAERLQGSIRDSGLFYESHLARWYKGELPREQLAREPQAWRILRFTPLMAAATAGQAGTMASVGQGMSSARLVKAALPPAPFLPTGVQAPPAAERQAPPLPASASPRGGPAVAATPAGTASAAPAATAASAAQAAERAAPEGAPRVSAEAAVEGRRPEGGRELIHESLQGLVRHQLEMLATPSLRWEGDVWSGLFMALVISLPQGRRDEPEGGDDAERRRERGHGGWRSELDLEVAGLGPLKVSLWMKEARLDIDLQSADEAALARLEAGLETLRQRLEGHGFEDVRLRLGHRGEGIS
ncbi:flagellar hook-length control protein FliK [Halomonas nitroreducens]|uniref:Flagellar hook-length control protein FliK n=1 Tax=Halomonas nitroreducens TaxID=447425 RepID=A0A3S0JAH0_9GAMM|nr:flagellar hook-length control protein FliK [Halomonas nitroreducens]RTR04423.1 flagellar hook-length control protein FliK [Halomonas nitroreducens]